VGNYYRVLRGVLSEGTHDGTPGGKPKMYGPGQPDGDIVDSKTNLLKHNPRIGEPKYRKLTDEEAAELLGGKDDGLEDLSRTDLQALAQREGIDLGRAVKKDEMVARIRDAAQAANAQ
jgi:hypothetical protein